MNSDCKKMKKQMRLINLVFLNSRFLNKKGTIIIVPIGSLKAFFLGVVIDKENFFSDNFPTTLRKINQVKRVFI
jgi:hypothetical protein